MEVVGGGLLVPDAGMVEFRVRWTQRRYTGNMSISRNTTRRGGERRLTRGRPKEDEGGRTQYAPRRVMVSL
jgi:hypothetical protein